MAIHLAIVPNWHPAIALPGYKQNSLKNKGLMQRKVYFLHSLQGTWRPPSPNLTLNDLKMMGSPVSKNIGSQWVK